MRFSLNRGSKGRRAARAVRRICPRCGGAFYLAAGVARCPHCNATVRAVSGEAQPRGTLIPKGFAEAMTEKIRFWREEIGRCVEEFGAGAIAPEFWALARSMGIDLGETRTAEGKTEQLLHLADAVIGDGTNADGDD